MCLNTYQKYLLIIQDWMNKTKEDFSPKRGLGQQEKKTLLAVEN